MQYDKINTNINTKESRHTEWAQWDKPNPENWKNCSSKCAYDCVQLQYTIQHRTVLIIFPFTSRQWIAQKLSIRGEGGKNAKMLEFIRDWNHHKSKSLFLCPLTFKASKKDLCWALCSILLHIHSESYRISRPSCIIYSVLHTHNVSQANCSITRSMYGTGTRPFCPRLLHAVHHCSSSLRISDNISPFSNGRSSAS